MKVLPQDEFLSLIETGYESRNREFKPPFLWSGSTEAAMREKLIQTVLGFSNTKGGGDIIIGIKDKNVELVGMKDEEITSFSFDQLKAKVDIFASSGVQFNLVEGRYDGKRFIIVRVSEFEETPIICRFDSSDGRKILIKNSIYTRSKSGPPATVKAGESELREIIEMAIDKGREKLRVRNLVYEESQTNSFKKQRGNF